MDNPQETKIIPFFLSLKVLLLFLLKRLYSLDIVKKGIFVGSSETIRNAVIKPEDIVQSKLKDFDLNELFITSSSGSS